MGQIIPFIKSVGTYRKLAEERAGKEDFSGALAFLFSAKSISLTYEVIMDIADAYADMGLLELSNKFWFMYMDKAPKEKVSVAYEELAINFFYLDNYWASSYYFHLKLTTDGQIMKDGLDKEIIDFFSGEEMKKNAYRVAYPFDRADYTFETKRAKHALAIGAFEEARLSLLRIPQENRTEEISGDLAVASFMSDELELAEAVCRDSLVRHGENVTALCNLSTVFDMREDADNAEYYYRKALGVRKGEKTEAYKIATCAIEREDHLTVKECLENILDDRPYELTMRFFYGVALINLGRFDRAKDQLKTAYRWNPSDSIVKYYLDLADRLISGEQTAEKLLPLEYVKELPKKVVKKYCQKIQTIAKTLEKIEWAVRNDEMKNLLEWAVYHADGQTARDAVYILSSGYTPYAKKLLLSALLDPEVKEEIKRVIIYVLIVKGHKEKFGAVAGNFYVRIKPKKLACERKDDGAVYFSAYALCVARVAFWDGDGLDKVALITDKVYNKLKDKISDRDVTNEEIAALVVSECAFKWCKSDRDVMNFFEIEKQKLDLLRGLLKGDKND